MTALSEILSRTGLVDELPRRASGLYARRKKLASRIAEAIASLESEHPLDVAFDMATSGRDFRLLYLLYQLTPAQRQDLLVIHGGLEPREVPAVSDLLGSLRSAPPLAAGLSLVYPSLHVGNHEEEYQEILERIRQAAKSRKDNLILSGRRLAVLPSAIAVLRDVTFLELCFSRLKELPPEIGWLKNLRTLSVGQNLLSALPREIGMLAQLTVLYAGHNQLSSLPPEIGRLKNLQWLDLSGNRLQSLPSEVCELKKLTQLNLSSNKLGALPSGLGQLTSLKHLIAEGNQLRGLPASIGRLTNLETLLIGSNEMESLPIEVGQLRQLDHLTVNSNRLSNLPRELGTLSLLKRLEAYDNPFSDLPPGLADDDGDALLMFLRDQAAERYEAKLLLLGDGNEGKTCLSRALRGEVFEPQQNTQGININAWRVPHPNDPNDISKEITLWLWDFEGQEINHQSHQFFLSRRSLYALVFNGRRGARMDRLEYWLDMIRARAPGCQVLIVATESGTRHPTLDLARLQARFSEMLPEDCYHRVGCKSGNGIDKLRARMARAATELELVPHLWPRSYQRVEQSLRRIAENRPRLTRDELNQQLTMAGIGAERHEMVARVLGDTGVITHFPYNLELRDFIVLNPPWLTRAISEALEADELVQAQGEMDLSWLKALWRVSYPGMFRWLFACMREFELCYPLEGTGDKALVPLRLSYARPQIPWNEDQDIPTREVEYRFDITPPAGLMSRFIVKTHRLIVKTRKHPHGVLWRDGVFLKSGDGGTRSEALCSFDEPRRTLRITVRSRFPQTMVEQLDFVARSVFDFFKGLRAERYYRCIETQSDGSPCQGFHEEKVVALHLARGRELLCSECQREVNPVQLVFGLNSFAWEDRIKTVLRQERPLLEEHAKDFGLGFYEIRARLQDIDSKLKGATVPRDELILRVKQSQREIITALDRGRMHHTPGIFSLTPLDRHPVNVTEVFNKGVQLRFYCEHERPHPSDARYEFTLERDWWIKTAPVFRLVFKVLNMVSRLSAAGLPHHMDERVFEELKHEVGLMQVVVTEVPDSFAGYDLAFETFFQSKIGRSTQTPWRNYDLLASDHQDVLRAMSELALLMKRIDSVGYSAHAFGELSRYRMPDNSFRWLCDQHGRQYR